METSQEIYHQTIVDLEISEFFDDAEELDLLDISGD